VDGGRKVERKLAAILSADVQGYSRLMSADEVATVRTLTAYREVLIAFIHRHRGRVVDAPGDNLLAEFGSAVNAVEGAVAIQRALTERNAKLMPERRMEFRIGINVGDVMVEGERLYGDGVNIAARLEGLAEAGGLCISGTVYDQIKTKVALPYEYLGERRVKNIAEPVRVYRVTWESEGRAVPAPATTQSVASSKEEAGGWRLETGPTSLQASSLQSQVSSIVGREAELAQLHQWLEKALNGERRIVFVTGEPGIGKTTLLEAFLFGVRSREEFGVPKSPKSKVQGPKSPNTDPRTPSPEPWFARGQCIEQYGPGEPYMPILEAFGRLCCTPEGKQVVTLLQQYAPTWLAQMPSLLTAAELEALQRTTQGATRERMLREMGEAIDVMTAERPLVLVLEDLHWSDVSTLELLALLARRREPARLLLIGTYRSSDLLSPDHPLKSGIQELRIHDLCTELALPPLSQDDIATYLQSRFAGRALPTTLPQVLYRRTEGHPFFLVTVVDDLVTQGLLVQTEQHLLVHGDIDAIVRQIPDSIRLLLTHQADRLLPLECRVLEAASVIGAEFATASLAAALEMDSEDVEEWCAGLAARQLFLQPAGFSEWPDGTASERYRFVHALSQQVWHERTGMIRRQRLHSRIAERHEAAYRNRTEEIAAELAVHFEQARDYARATRYLAQAAEGAIRRCAHEEAVTHLTKSLALLRTLPDTPARTQQELALHTTLGISLQAVRGYGNPLVEQAYARARALSARVHEPEQLFPVLFGLWQLHLTRAEYSIARTQGDQLLRLAQRSHNSALLTEAHGLVGVTLFHFGEIGAAQRHLEAGMAVYDPAQHRSLAKTYSQDPWVACRSYSAHVLWLLGYRDQAFTRVREALHYARELGHPFSEAFALHDLVFIHQFSDNASAVRAEVEVLLALAREHGFQHWELAAQAMRGWALAREGDSGVGLGLLREGSGVRQNLGSNLRMPYHHARMAELYGQAEQPDEGLHQLEKAVRIMTTTGERWWEAEIYRLKGTLTLEARGLRLETSSPSPQAPSLKPLVSRGVEQEAEGYFLKAIEVSRHQQAKSLELRAAMSLARLWQQQGKHHEAHTMLSDIYHWFTEGFDTKDLQEARGLLVELRH
jgi:class 3 adenylate cyclase/predicted ATPase